MSPGAPTSMVPPRSTGLPVFLRLIRFSHTLFALPYAITGFVVGWRSASVHERPLGAVFAGVLVAMVAARTAAMTFNRLVDRRFDATNPRTATRPSVTGEVSVATMRTAVIVSSAAFCLAAAWLNPLCGWLSFVALLVILGYSLAKRRTALVHFVLGLALGLSPVGAYLAVHGAFDAGCLGVAWLGLAVLVWTAGFDILYACDDIEHDRREGLHSIPARLGVEGALRVARISHAFVPVFLALAGLSLGLGWIFACGVGVVALLLVYEHRLVRPDDLSRVGTAFFQVNVAISVLVMASALVSVWVQGGRGQ